MTLISNALGQSHSNSAELNLDSVKDAVKDAVKESSHKEGDSNEQILANYRITPPNETEDRRSPQITTDAYVRDLRIRGIEQRIDILKNLIAHQAETQSDSNSAQSTEPLASEASTSPTEIIRSEVRLPSTTAEQLNLILPKQSEEPVKIDTDNLPQSLSDDLAGISITSSPINSLELANSLFRSGHHQQALRSYQELLNQNSKDLDEGWLKLLAANCHRVLKDTSAAERLYREVTSLKEKSYAFDHSRWYLNHLSQKKELETQWNTIESEISSYQPQQSAIEGNR